MKKINFAIIFILIIVLLIPGPYKYLLRSISVMSVYSNLHESQSNAAFHIKIPGGLITPEKDWYPFVMTFNADKSFQYYTGRENINLSIMYNFPEFSPEAGYSMLYDKSSEYYNSFYGAYIVDDPEKIYGFEKTENGLKINPDEVADVAAFDFSRLVLGDFGLKYKNFIFETDIADIEENITYMGMDDWIKSDINLTVSGAEHNPNGFVASYIQYGTPKISTETPFEPVNMYGRIYAKYLPKYNQSIFMYIVASDKTVLEECDKNILSKSIMY